MKATRASILDATIAVLGEGIAALSIPAVARRAGVSVPTVYRYFPDKEALLEAAAVHVRSGLGVAPDAPSPTDVDEYLKMHRQVFRRLADADAETVGAVVATFGRGAGAMSLHERTAWLAPVFGDALDNWSDTDRRNLLRIAAILSSSVGATALGHFGLTGDAAADLLDWTVRRLVSPPPQAGRGKPAAQTKEETT